MSAIRGRNAGQRSEARAGLVTITVGIGHTAVVDPPVPELRHLVEYPYRATEPGGPTGWTETVVDVAAWDAEIKGRVAFPAGLLRSARVRLRALGYRVRVDDQRTDRPEFRADAEFVESLTDPKAEAFLAAVGKNRLGQIEVVDDDDAVDRLVVLARAYPAARIAVAVATRRDASRLTHKLGERLQRRRIWRKDEWGQDERRVRVITFGHLGALDDRPWDVLVLPNGDEAVGTVAGGAICRIDHGRRYAFVRPRRRPDRLTETRMEMIAGPVIVRVKKPRAAVRVTFLPTSAVPVTVPGDPVQARRALYWQNTPRNLAIATVAELVMRRDGAALRQCGLNNPALDVLKRPALKAVILVENTEHAHALRQLLPTWGQMDLVPGEGDTAKPPNPAVVTEAYAATHPVAADVVIRATGTPWSLRMKTFPPVRRYDRPDVLVIDFLDGFNPLAADYARRRREEYVRAGMDVIPSANPAE